METKIGFRHKFAYSLFDFSAYKEFLVQGFGKSIFYIFIVTLIFSIITNIKEIDTINSEISNVEDNLIHNSPGFEFKNGLLSVDTDEIIYYKHDGEFLFNFLSAGAVYFNTVNSENNSKSTNIQDQLMDSTSTSDSDDDIFALSTDKPNYYMMIVDTKGKTTQSILDTYKDGIYVDSNHISLKKDYRTIGTINFSDCSWLDFNKDTMLGILDTFKIIVPISLMGIKPILSFMENLFLGLIILGPFTIFIGSFIGVKLNYAKACTLGFYAMTLPLLLEALLHVAGIVIPEFSIVFYMVAFLYCGLAVNALKNGGKSKLNLFE